MFGFLKDKLKEAIGKFSKRAEEEAEDGPEIEEAPVIESKKEEKSEKTVSKKDDSKKVKEDEKLSSKKKEDTKSKKSEKKEEKKDEKKEEKKSDSKPDKKQKNVEQKIEDDEEIEDDDSKEELSEKKSSKKESVSEEISESNSEEIVEEQPKKKGFFSAISGMFGKKKKTEEKAEVEPVTKDLQEEITTEALQESVKKTSEKERKEQSTIEPTDQKTTTQKTISQKPSSQDKKEIDRLEKGATEEEEIEKELYETVDKRDVLGKEHDASTKKEKSTEEKKQAKKEEDDIEKIIVDESVSTFDEAEDEKTIERESRKNAAPIGVQEEKKGFFASLGQKFATKKISDSMFEELFWELEIAMLENSVAVEVIEKIKTDLRTAIVGKPIAKEAMDSIISTTLMQSIESLFDQQPIKLLENIDKKAKNNQPYVICFVGINGSGKTTTIAKLAHYLKRKGYTCIVAAADTFRAAAIDQLEHHADAVGFKLIRHDYNSDPAAVAFDAVKHAESKPKSVVLIDTAGRLHSNTNLMSELQKVIRVSKPDLTVFIGESITGNDCIEQARQFNDMVKIDGIILSKADVDQKGGAAISISYVLNKPIMYLGVGQNYEDLRVFTPDLITDQLSFSV